MITKKPTELKIGDRFIDPRREGRRPAKVIRIVRVEEQEVTFILDDDTKWSAWIASYRTSEDLEIA